MGVYAVTGSTSGIGAAIATKLKSLGHQIISIDLRDADINVDLSTDAGRQTAIDAIQHAAPDGLDGFVPCAGVGPQTNPITRIARINYFGTVVMVEALQQTLVKKSGRVLLICSNSAWVMPYDADYMQALLDHDEARAVEIVAKLDGQGAYGGSKQALGRWMRKHNLSYAQAGIRMNAIAPGYTRTNLTESARNNPAYSASMDRVMNSIPIGRPGEPEDQAEAAAFLLSDQASFISGSILFVDGGHDAMWRPDVF